MTEEGKPSFQGDLLFGNILVGLGMGWLTEHYWPATHPWGLAGGLILGLLSAFWQILKTSALPKLKKKSGDKDGPAS